MNDKDVLNTYGLSYLCDTNKYFYPVFISNVHLQYNINVIILPYNYIIQQILIHLSHLLNILCVKRMLHTLGETNILTK